ncbi:DUF1684 domain-containing protein [Pseudoxanthomonas helianthi]|uniref:DUF1684 domain-containing protein n=1 Tax=Pseudoxanthomonas helianthi TaxID=1453541 RepID=A0A941B100_9GAMM|nr:DUF1684 domain-containing protein [Pseudoxanthomonas helianthi]MBP3985818.1 DUF1684 domain-containing protein [Pseudoxanthomonas helianthi]
MTKRAWSLAAMFVALCACQRGAPGPDAAELAAKKAKAEQVFLAENAAWREQRRQELLQPDGWTSLVGLHWLDPGAHYIGSGGSSGIRLAVGPAKMGMLVLKQDRIEFTPESGAALTLDGEPLKGRVELHSDREQTPSVIGFDEGKGKLTVIRRGDRYALRVKHADAPSRVNFAGVQYWNADPSWRLVGKFVANPPGKTIPIVDIVGMTTDSPNPGAVEFVRDGKTYRIEALAEDDSGALFLVFADRTSGHGSYPAGRFLDAAKPDAQGRVVLDFNRAYDPPCAFTPFATCPLPPPENRLDLAITAGEKAYAHPESAPDKEVR